MESLSTSLSRAGRDTSGGKKPWLWMLLFPLLQMGTTSSRTTPLKCILKTGASLIPRVYKKTHLIFFCDTEWPWYPLKDGRQWPVEGSLNYDTVLQLDQFCRKQGKWVEAPYVLLFSSLWDMPDLCPKGTDMAVKPSAPSNPLTLPLYMGLPTEQAENQSTCPGEVASVSVEFQTVPIVVEAI